MLALGLAAFIPALSRTAEEAELPPLKVDASYGQFLGIFPLNIFNKAALVLFGAAGILASRSESETPALVYARTVAFSMAPLAILGAIPRTQTLFGYWPLFGAEVSTHGAFAALGAYAGFRDTLAKTSDVIRSDLIQRQDDERLLAARG